MNKREIENRLEAAEALIEQLGKRAKYVEGLSEGNQSCRNECAIWRERAERAEAELITLKHVYGKPARTLLNAARIEELEWVANKRIAFGDGFTLGEIEQRIEEIKESE